MKRKRWQSPQASQELVPEVIYQVFKLLVHLLCKILSLGKDVLYLHNNPSH
jgi:membrane protein required for beta-lactamase induction